MTIVQEKDIEFLNQDYFEARKVVIVAKKIQPQSSGRSHGSSRGSAVGTAYCYEDICLGPNPQK